MGRQLNFLLGQGRRLTDPIAAPRRNSDRTPPYDFAEARARLSSMIAVAGEEARRLTADECPRGDVVAVLTLHPQSLAKSYHPTRFIGLAEFEQLGSRPARVEPEKWSRNRDPAAAETTDLFVSVQRKRLERLSSIVQGWQEYEISADELSRVERIRLMTEQDRVRVADLEENAFECVLHQTEDDQELLRLFVEFAARRDAEVFPDRRIHAGGLTFVPALGGRASAESLGRFSLLRAIRPLPHLRPVVPITRSVERAAVQLPLPYPIADDVRVAIFDGGMPDGSSLLAYARCLDADGVGKPLPEYLAHGEQVTSALLFGPLSLDQELSRPVCQVDHYRVLDQESAIDPLVLYDVLRRIQTVLKTGAYPVASLSIGPAFPVEDEDVHPWTAVLDELLADGRCLAVLAAGNCDGTDHESDDTRIQVPSDCVNALCVGAADSSREQWGRASYSRVGPGRSPGLVKPDVLGFGGSTAEPFLVVSAAGVAAVQGTSFAAPVVARRAAEVLAYMGPQLSPLAIRALIVHTAERHDERAGGEEWGRVAGTLDDLLLCDDCEVRVVYEGELLPGQYIRAQLPSPRSALVGNATLTATASYVTGVDPEDPGNYTRSGLDITFRPHRDKVARNGNPRTRSLFRLSDYLTEQELRSDAHKWECTMHTASTLRGSSLLDPVLDIHYNARSSGMRDPKAPPLRYALVITLRAERVGDLYNAVRQRYRDQLEPLIPRLQVPVRVA